MKLIFERSRPGHRIDLLPPSDVPAASIESGLLRTTPPVLPELSEGELARHYEALAAQVHGVNKGFYPLGSCTMKYNPRIDEDAAALPGFTGVHPLQPLETVEGCRAVLHEAEARLCAITGMDAMSFQPAAGAHGEFTGLLLIKQYHEHRGDSKRRCVIVPDSAHGTNPASAAMCGYRVINVQSTPEGYVDLEKLRAALGEDTAALMLTNPNTVGLFDPQILEITRLVHEAGGLCYYDGANLNPIMGWARPGDMGFDVVHLNLHKTFATPHGGGGPGSGPVGCKDFLRPFLPSSALSTAKTPACQVRAFHGNFLVVVRALSYLDTLGGEGVREAGAQAVLGANYLMHLLREGGYVMAYDRPCMHEFVITLQALRHETGVSALDIAKALLDYGMHPPTMYFPLIVSEALMAEPTETESLDSLREAAEVYIAVLRQAIADPASMHEMPRTTCVRRLDEVKAARNPIVKYEAAHSEHEHT